MQSSDHQKGGPILVNEEEMGHLVNFVGDFAYSMLRTFVCFQDEMSEEARSEFDGHVRGFTARVGEWFPIERLIEQAAAEQRDGDAA